MYDNQTYLNNNPSWHAEDSPFKANWINRILIANGLDPLSIAEIGCGAGGVLVELQKLRPTSKYFGFEISPDAFQICSSKSADGIEFHLEDIIESDRSGFSLLMINDVFEHVPDYMGFLEALKGKAEYTIFHIPLELSAQAMLRGAPYLAARESVGHLHYFFKDTALATLTDCGYEIVDWEYTSGAMQIPNQRLRTRLMNIPRKILEKLNHDFAARSLGGYSMIVLAR